MDINDTLTELNSSADGANKTLDMLSMHDTLKTQLYIVMGILSFLSVMGTAGNALVLYVFSQKKDKLVSTLFIIVLAFVDFITCLVVIPYTIYMEYVDFQVDYDAVCKTYQFLITSNIPFSAMIMVAIAVDRYFCICHPFLHALNIFRAKIMVAALALMAVMLGLCVALMYGVYRNIPMLITHPNMTNTSVDAILDSMDTTGLHGLVPMSENTGTNSFTLAYHAEILQHSMLTPSNSTDNSTDLSLSYYGIRFTGSCDPNELIISSTFRWYYQKFYTALYLVCLIIVVILYTLIYRSVLARRTKRQKQKSKSLPLIQMSNERTMDTNTEETQLTVATEANGGSKTPPMDTNNGAMSKSASKNGATAKVAARAREKELKEREKQRRKSLKKDRNRMANLKTAAMLFVVTVVFIVTFFPAFLMANKIISYNIIIFYIYFANNVANPIIYSFMNKNFRDDLKKLFKC